LDTVVRSANGNDLYTLTLIGPSGDWKITDMQGVVSISETEGIIPKTILVERDPQSELLRIVFEYSSPEVVTTVFGDKIPPGKSYNFEFQRFEKKMDWQVRFFNYDEASDPLKNEAAFSELKKQKPAAEKVTDDLAFAWWGSPLEGVNEDKFATFSSTEFDIAAGKYILELTSDDGARLYLDGKRLIDNWDVHEPETDEITVTLGGHHRIEVDHFEAGGFSTLDFRIKPK
jgi:hypothetical protein